MNRSLPLARPRRAHAPIAAALALALAPAVAWAEAPLDAAAVSAARSLAQEGVALFDRGDYAGAQEKLVRADELVHLPTTGLMVARTLEKLGRWVEASEKYLAVTRIELAKDANDAQVTAKAKAEAERGALVAKLPSLTVRLDPSLAGAEVALDGKPMPAALVGVKLPANPGDHVVTATRGAEKVEAKVAAVEAKSAEVVLRGDPNAPKPAVVAPPAAPPSPAPVAPAASGGSALRTAGYVALGVGGASIVAGAVLGGMTFASKSKLESEGCDASGCPRSAESDLSKHDALRAASMGTLYGGVGVAAVGVVLLLVAPKDASRSSGRAIAPWVGAGDVGVRGTF